jgi:hypothetical protein
MGDGDGPLQTGKDSLDVDAKSRYDAAHLYLTHVVRNPGCGIPTPDASTMFEVSTEGKILNIDGQRP